MPITTTSELRSAANWYPAPPNHDPADLLNAEADWQSVSWTFSSLTLQEELALYRALLWSTETRSVLTGDLRLISTIVLKSTGTISPTLKSSASRVIVIHDQRSVALQE